MTFWRRLFGRKSAARPFEEVMAAIHGDYVVGEASGVPVTAMTALRVSTVLACVDVLAKGCATPELHVYRDADGRRELADREPVYRLLNRRPNEWQTSFEFRRMMTAHMALTGNAVALKVMNGSRLAELVPVLPGHVEIRRFGRYEVEYRVADEWGPVGVFGPRDVLHLPNLAWDWLKGLDAVRLAASAIGLAISAEQTHAAFHRNGVRSSGFFSVDGTLSKEKEAAIRGYVERNHTGVANAGRPFILDMGAKWNQLAMTGVDAQHVETRRLQIEEICRAYSVFPIMIGHADKTATFASSEAFFAAHYKHTLMPMHRLWCQRLDEYVLDGKGPLYAEFDARYLLAGSMRDRAQWARTMAELGIYTRNELRDEEGRDPLPGLDEPLTPLNMTKTPTRDAADDQDTPQSP